jgi:hypothetical protein
MKSLRLVWIHWLAFCLWMGVFVSSAWAGPPFTTDDPETVPYQHWEIYLATQLQHDDAGWHGNLPELETNYGALPDIQLHMILPLFFNAPDHGPTVFGYGDVELGVKARFLEEGPDWPQAGTFVLAEVPTGNQDQGLGIGHLQVFIPIWLQKTIDKLTTYGGGGYWINTGEGHKNYWFLGWEAQYQLIPNLAVGAEINYQTPPAEGLDTSFRFNAGFILDLSEQHHILFSGGRDFQKPSQAQFYLAYLLTFGPTIREPIY